jgi:hypothetical protein
MPRSRVSLTVIIFSLVVVFSLLLYAFLLHVFAARFVAVREPLYLVSLLYIPSTILIALVFTVSPLWVCLFAGGEAGFSRVLVFLKSVMPIVLASIVGFIVSLVSGVQSEASVRVFILGTSYASLVLSILVIVWFFLVLPAMPLKYCVAKRRVKLSGLIRSCWLSLAARWILSLMVSGWLTVLLRVLLVRASPLFGQLLFYSRTGDWIIDSIQARFLPRVADLVAAPIWLLLLAYTYSRLLPWWCTLEA